MNRDLVIVGLGPAGVAAALWARTRGIACLAIEASDRPGGQLHHIHFHPCDLPGIDAGDGPAIAATFARQLRDAGLEIRTGAAATALVPGPPGPPAVEIAGGERIEGAAILIATGLRKRRLEVRGERELEGRGVSFSATLDRAQFAGHDSVVVGGGDAAYENALLLAGVGCRVAIAMRGAPRARADFLARVAAEPRIEVLSGVRVVAFVGAERLEAVRLEGRGGAFDRPAFGAVIKIGMVPNTEWCRPLALDPEGYVGVDVRGRTGVPGVWAVGDVTRPSFPSVTVAEGNAALAVADLERVVRPRQAEALSPDAALRAPGRRAPGGRDPIGDRL